MLVAALLWCVAGAAGTPWRSVVGDPGMAGPPRFLLEGWNMCNRAGAMCTEAPRWADCILANASGAGPHGNAVTAKDNAAGLVPSSKDNVAACDAVTEAKERALGGRCRVPGKDGVNASYFWTAVRWLAGLLGRVGYAFGRGRCALCAVRGVLETPAPVAHA